MSDDAPTRFPYQHLAVLGMDKVKKYVPPAAAGKEAAPGAQEPRKPVPGRRDGR